MTVSALTVDPLTGLPAVQLTDEAGGAPVSIGVGLGEASAIAAELSSIDFERPLTHQLMSDLLTAAGAKVVRIELREPCVKDLSQALRVATVTLELVCGNQVLRDARPSDAFALALRAGLPIYVASAVVARAAREACDAGDVAAGGEVGKRNKNDQPHDPLALLREHPCGKWKM